ncbi:hypothetical protein I3843_14G081500 [Carya illinoinensis]|nr:hypothetical protein I3843_14G081500 [Carya illinoinensis]
MAANRSFYARPSYRFLPNYREHHNPLIAHDSVFEIDDSDIYDSPEFLMPSPAASRISKKPSSKPSRASSADLTVVASTIPSSLPVNIPDWSKILRGEYTENHREEGVDYDDADGEEVEEFEKEVRVPPHEFLARTRIASFSVHEGMGRTLKGRDLSRVRNAIWEKTGFQD